MAEGQESAVYVSAKGLWNFGQTYSVFSDRIQLDTLWGCFVVPLADLVKIEICPPPVARTSLLALKLDWADFFRHVGITRRSGYFHRLRFTPDNPEAFVAAVVAAQLAMNHRS